jgi:hypothetical protein
VQPTRPSDELKKLSLTPQGEQQLKLYCPTFEIMFREWPDWIKYYPQVTWELVAETDMHVLWRAGEHLSLEKI